jgi:hypothetical protein
VAAVGKAAAEVADAVQVSGAVRRRPVRVATASAPTAGIRYLTRWGNLAISDSAPSVARP